MAITRAKTGKQIKGKLGSGKRFKKLAKKTSPALAAYIGRKSMERKSSKSLQLKEENVNQLNRRL